MKQTELLLVDGRAQVADALAHMEADCPFTLRSAFARRPGSGEQVIWSEFANGATRSTPKTVGITDKSVA